MRLLGTDAHDQDLVAPANPRLMPGTAQIEEREGERGHRLRRGALTPPAGRLAARRRTARPRGAMLAAHMPASRA